MAEKLHDAGSGILEFHCPGCNSDHCFFTIQLAGRPCSTWNKSMESPTFSPSLRVNWGNGHVCHSYVRGGQIQFLNDCTHSLAGKTVDLPDWENSNSGANEMATEETNIENTSTVEAAPATDTRTVEQKLADAASYAEMQLRNEQLASAGKDKVIEDLKKELAELQAKNQPAPAAAEKTTLTDPKQANTPAAPTKTAKPKRPHPGQRFVA